MAQSMEERGRAYRHHVFLSHSHDHGNHAHVMAIAVELRKVGINVWVDETHFEGDESALSVPITVVLRNALRASRCVILFVDQEYILKIQEPPRAAGAQPNYCQLEYLEAMSTRNPGRIAIIRTEECGWPSSWPAPLCSDLYDRYVANCFREQPISPQLIQSIKGFCLLQPDVDPLPVVNTGQLQRSRSILPSPARGSLWHQLTCNAVWMKNVFPSDEGDSMVLYKFQSGDRVWDNAYSWFRHYMGNMVCRRLRVLHETAADLVVAEEVLYPIPFLHQWKIIYSYSFADGTAALVSYPSDASPDRMALRFEGPTVADSSAQSSKIGIVWYWPLPAAEGELLPGEHTEIVEYRRSESGQLVGDPLHVTIRKFKQVKMKR